MSEAMVGERSESAPGAQRWRVWRLIGLYALIVLVGMNLRSVILAVPPIVPTIQRDLGLSYTIIGLLTSLPVLVMGALAWPAGVLAGRIGARRAVAWGLALLAAGGLLRAVWPQAIALYAFTFLLSLGIALAQTTMPILARQWFPQRIGLVSALYSDGLIVGETLAAALTTSFVASLFGAANWRATFIFWSLPVALSLLIWLRFAPSAPALAPSRKRASQPTAGAPMSPAAPVRVVRSWSLGFLIGGASLVFFSMNAWIAAYNAALGHTEMTALSLTVLNAAQIPVSVGMTPFAQRLAGRRWPFIVGGTLFIVAIVGWVATPVDAQPLWSAVLGGSSAFIFVLGIALPALLARQEDVGRLTGITLTLSYGVAFVGPFLGGGLWDLTGIPALAFAPVVLAGITTTTLGALLPARRHFGLLASPSLARGASAAGQTDASEAETRS